MPNYQPLYQPLDRVYYALADATRRAVLERLTDGPASVSDLAAAFAMALPSFTQHLDVLEGCDLVFSEKVGRVRTYHLKPDTLFEAERWLVEQHAFWEARLNRLDRYLLTMKGNKI